MSANEVCSTQLSHHKELRTFICAVTIVSGGGGQTVRPRQQKVSNIPRRPFRIYLALGIRSGIADMSGNVAFVVRPWPGAMGNIGATVEIRQHPAAEGEKTGATGEAAAAAAAVASAGYLWPASAAKIARRLGFNISPPTRGRSFL